jgi:hypothetical protein
MSFLFGKCKTIRDEIGAKTILENWKKASKSHPVSEIG